MPTSQLSEIKGTGDYKRKPGMEIVRLERQNCGRIGGADSDWGLVSSTPKDDVFRDWGCRRMRLDVGVSPTIS